MLQAISKHVPIPGRAGLAALLNPRFTALAIRLMGRKGGTFNPLFRNTVTPTLVRGGEQINVVPNEVSADLDGRLLPGLGPAQLLAALTEIAASGATIPVLRQSAGAGPPDLGRVDG